MRCLCTMLAITDTNIITKIHLRYFACYPYIKQLHLFPIFYTMRNSFITPKFIQQRKSNLNQSRSTYLKTEQSVSPLSRNNSSIKLNPHQCLPIIKNVRPNDVTHEVEICKWRSSTDYHIFKVYDYNCKPTKNNHYTLQMRCELPARQLSSILSLTIENSLYILKQMSFSIQKLIQIFGPFRITEKMIGFSKENVCKLWVHEKYEYNVVMEKEFSESQMIRTMVGLILNKTKAALEIKQKLKNVLYQTHSFFEFGEAIWKFSYSQHIMIPHIYITLSEQLSNSKIKRTCSKLQLNNSKLQLSHSSSQLNKIPLNLKMNKNTGDTIRRFSTLSSRYHDQKNRGMQQLTNIRRTNEKENMSPFLTQRQQARKKLTKSFNENNNDKEKIVQFQILNKSTNPLQTSKSKFFDEIQEEKEDAKTKAEIIKKMIKNKVNKANKNFKITYLDACGTVKSIGEFLESERDLEAELREVQILRTMGREVKESMIEDNT